MTTPGRNLPTRVARTVSFVQVDPAGATIVCALGDGDPVISGNGGWGFVQRPRAKAITEWSGYDGLVLSVPVMFDAFAKDGSVEGPVERLRRMMRNPQGVRVEPAVVKVVCPALPLPNLRWVLQEMTPTLTARRPDGARSRAGFDVSLFEYSPPALLVAARKATPAARVGARAGAPATTTTKTYTVKRGDTLGAIAARLLGSSSKWNTLANLNGIRDPKALTPGQVLRLP